MLRTEITDGFGRKTTARVEDRALLVSNYPSPPIVPQKVKVFRQPFTDDGLSTGSYDLLVDGSVTSVDFWIPADTENDRYITRIDTVVAYASTSRPLAQWGSGTALTTGSRLYYTRQGEEIDIHNAIQVDADLMRLGSDPNFVEVRSMLASNDYGYVIQIDLTKLIPPYGLKFDRETTQKIILTINDDQTATPLTYWNMIAYGFERFE